MATLQPFGGVNPEAAALNERYLATMHAASATTTLGRIRDLWWEGYETAFAHEGVCVVDRLDEFMNLGRDRLFEMADEYSQEKAAAAPRDRQLQLRTQFLKSNTGKMFERFVGLAISHALLMARAPYCIGPLKNEWIRLCHGLTPERLTIKIGAGEDVVEVRLDADLFAFNPVDADADIFFIGVKSTLKERFHHIPYWNLLRRCSVSSDLADIVASDASVLSRLRYVAICSDLAEEQPDFRSEGGPRRLLRSDATLLDGAYVTSARAIGIPDHGPYLGHPRSAAFHRLQRFVEILENGGA